MHTAKIIMTLLAFGGVSFAAPVEKREAGAAAQIIAPPPAMLGPLGLKTITLSSSSTVEVTSSTPTPTVTVIVTSTPDDASTVVASTTYTVSASSSFFVSISNTPVPTYTLVTVINAKLASTSVASSSTVQSSNTGVPITTTASSSKLHVWKAAKPKATAST